MADENDYKIKITADAAGVAPATEEAAAGLKKFEAETSAAQAAADRLGVSVTQASKALASLKADEEAKRFADLKTVLGLSAEQTAALAKEEEEAQAQAAKLGVNINVVRAAMVAIKRENAAAEFNNVKQALLAANQGAEQTVEKLADTGEAVDQVGVNFDHLNKDLSSFRGAGQFTSHLTAALKGGGEGFRGLSGLVRLFGTALEGLPLVSGLLILGSVVGSVYGAWRSKQDEANLALDAAKKKTDALKNSTGELGAELGKILTIQDKILQQEKDRGQVVNAANAEEIKRLQIEKQGAIEEARFRYLKALANAKTEDERKKLKEKFDKEKAEIEGQSAIAIAAQTVKSKQDEIGGAQNVLGRFEKDRADNQTKKNNQQDAANAATDFFTAKGITPDENGDYGAAARKFLSQKTIDNKDSTKVDEARAKLINLKRQAARGQGRGSDLAKKQLPEAQAAYDQAREESLAVKTALDAIGEYKKTDAELQQKITDQLAQIDAQKKAIDQLQNELKTATLEQRVTGATEQNNLIESGVTPIPPTAAPASTVPDKVSPRQPTPILGQQNQDIVAEIQAEGGKEAADKAIAAAGKFNSAQDQKTILDRQLFALISTLVQTVDQNNKAFQQELKRVQLEVAGMKRS